MYQIYINAFMAHVFEAIMQLFADATDEILAAVH